MNFVGKVLIVLNVVLAFMFMAFAGAVYTAQKNWSDEITKQKTRADGLNSSLQTAITEKNKLQEEYDGVKANLSEAAKTAEAENMGLRQTVATLQGQLSQTRDEREAFQTESRLASELAADRLAESLELRVEISKLRAKIDTQIAQLRQRADEVLSKERQLTSYEAKNTLTVERLANAERLLRVNDLDPDEIVDPSIQEPPPKVFGRVLDARKNRSGSTEFVHVSIGADDGLEKGHKLMLYREGKFLGDIRLVDVNPDDAVGVVIFKSKNGIIERGDYAASKL